MTFDEFDIEGLAQEVLEKQAMKPEFVNKMLAGTVKAKGGKTPVERLEQLHRNATKRYTANYRKRFEGAPTKLTEDQLYDRGQGLLRAQFRAQQKRVIEHNPTKSLSLLEPRGGGADLKRYATKELSMPKYSSISPEALMSMREEVASLLEKVALSPGLKGRAAFERGLRTAMSGGAKTYGQGMDAGMAAARGEAGRRAQAKTRLHANVAKKMVEGPSDRFNEYVTGMSNAAARHGENVNPKALGGALRSVYKNPMGTYLTRNIAPPFR